MFLTWYQPIGLVLQPRPLHFGNMPSSMRPTFGRQSTTDASSSDPAQHEVVMQSVVVDDKGAAPVAAPAVGASGNTWDEGLDKDAQLGVRKAQATTLSWSKTALYTTLSWYVRCPSIEKYDQTLRVEQSDNDFSTASGFTLSRVVSDLRSTPP